MDHEESIKAIIEDYKKIYSEDIDAQVVEELLVKYSETEVRRLLGILPSITKICKVRKIFNGCYLRVKILKKWDEKTVKDGRRIRIYFVGDETGIMVLTDRGGANIEEGKQYLIGPIKLRDQKPRLGNVEVYEAYLFENSTVQEIVYPKIEAHIEEIKVDPRIFAYKPFIAYIEGTVVDDSMSRNVIILNTEAGRVYVRIPSFVQQTKLEKGSRIRIYGVYPDRHGLAVSTLGKIEKIGEAEKFCIEGVVISSVSRSTSSGKGYYIYVVSDGEKIYKFFHRSEKPLKIYPGDLVRICGMEISSGYTYTNHESLDVGKYVNLNDEEVLEVIEISKYSPKYLIKTSDKYIYTDNKANPGDKISTMIRGSELGGKFIGIELENVERGTVLSAECADEECTETILEINTGEDTIPIRMEGDLRHLVHKDVIIIRDEEGNIKDLRPI